ncbi:hypothetical protein ScPMuIL_017389 [Solemya velum]
MCSDLRKVNQLIQADSYPMRRIDDCIDRVGNAKFITKLDLLKGYYQIPLNDRAKKVLAIIMPDGLYSYKTVPFGLKTAGAVFQRMVNKLLRQWDDVDAYLDDVMITSDQWNAHLRRLRDVFQKFLDANLTLNLAKCEFGSARVECLGHVVGLGKVLPAQAKIDGILKYPQPTNRREVRRILGSTGFYRRFCPNYSTVAAPLTDLLKKDRKFKWTPECEKAFQLLKQLLCSSPVVAAPNFARPFKLAIDSSNTGTGAVLFQEDESGFDHPKWRMTSIPYCYQDLKRIHNNGKLVQIAFALLMKFGRIENCGESLGQESHWSTGYHLFCAVYGYPAYTGTFLAKWISPPSHAPRMTSLVLLVVMGLVYVCAGRAASHLRKLEEEFWDWRMLMSPEFGTAVEYMKYNDRVESFDPDRFPQMKKDVEEFLLRLKSIKSDHLNKHEQINHAVFTDTLMTFLNGYRWRHYGALNPISFMEGIQTDPAFMISLTPFDTIGDFENFLSRLVGMPKQIQDYMKSFRKAIELGRTHHNVSVNRIPDQINRIVSSDYNSSMFYKPFLGDLANLTTSTSEQRQDLRERAKAAIRTLNTEFGILSDFIKHEYMPKTRVGLGIGSWNRGSEYYTQCLKWHLSVDMTPEEVSQMGLQEVQRIYSKMTEISKRHGFDNDVQQFFSFMKNNSAFYINSPVEILRAFRNLISERISPVLPKYFKDMPNVPLRVVALPTDGPAAMYRGADGKRPGTFNVNVIRPEKVPTYEMLALALHEGLPGHHLQITYSQTTSKMPKFRRFVETRNYVRVPFLFPFYTAYTEGWGLYAERVGEEMGLYKDDFELMGRYAYEIFRASRLVVDTGIHYFNWTRERAVEYVVTYTAFDKQIVENEIDRYATFPGQACAYKVGEIRIHQMREMAEEMLGERFDVRDFHLTVLENGALPLHLLERVVREWVHSVKATTDRSGEENKHTPMCKQTSPVPISVTRATSSSDLFWLACYSFDEVNTKPTERRGIFLCDMCVVKL